MMEFAASQRGLHSGSAIGENESSAMVVGHPSPNLQKKPGPGCVEGAHLTERKDDEAAMGCPGIQQGAYALCGGSAVCAFESRRHEADHQCVAEGFRAGERR
jgi:hypothetical protein